MGGPPKNETTHKKGTEVRQIRGGDFLQEERHPNGAMDHRNLELSSSALGQGQTFNSVRVTSALPLITDSEQTLRHVGYGPILLQKSVMTGAWRPARTSLSSRLPSTP